MCWGKISLKLIDLQTKIRPCRWEFIFKINKRACTSIRYTRVWLVLTGSVLTPMFWCPEKVHFPSFVNKPVYMVGNIFKVLIQLEANYKILFQIFSLFLIDFENYVIFVIFINRFIILNDWKIENVSSLIVSKMRGRQRFVFSWYM